MTVFFIAAVIAGLLCAALTGTQQMHAHITGRRENDACHELHDGEVPRLGGAAIFTAGLVSLSLLSASMDDSTARLLWSLWACLSLITLLGLYEDIKRNMPPLGRYALSSVAVLMFSLANGALGIDSVGIVFLEPIFNLKIVAVSFFVFAVTGATHAFNLIDGQNGLSSGVASLSLFALAAVSHTSGQSDISLFCSALAGANFGFLLLNYPFGRIFLGDCGAYLNGAAVGALSVIVVARGSGEISPWFALTILIYPAWDTLHSMYRRRRRGQSAFLPDIRHLHHLIYWRNREGPSWLKHSSAPIILVLATPPMVLGVLLPANTPYLASVCLFSVAVYSYIHARYDRILPTQPTLGHVS